MSEEKSELKKVATTEAGIRVFKLEQGRPAERALLGFLERGVEQLCRAQKREIEDYLRLHRESNKKGPNGWLRDLVGNLWKAELEGLKTIRIDELIG